MASPFTRFLCSGFMLFLSLQLEQLACAQDSGAKQFPDITHDQLKRARGVVSVTDLSDSLQDPPKRGTLRYALKTSPVGSTITFSSPGTIRLAAPLEVTTQNITIDGTSNPVVISGDTLRIRASGVTLKHLWILAGDALPSGSRPGVNGHSKPGERDALTILGDDTHGAAPLKNTTIEHCWIGLGIDECMSTYGRVDGLTVTQSIIGYGLNRSLHPKDLSNRDAPGHGKGMLVGLNASNVTFRENLFVHNFDRNLAVREGVTDISFINNVIYNFGRGNTFMVGGGGVKSSGIFAGNVYIAGKDSWSKIPPLRALDDETARSFLSFANVGTIDSDGDIDQALAKDLGVVDAALRTKFRVVDAQKAYHAVLRTAGPHPALNDALSKRAVSEVLNRSGGVIDYVTVSRNTAATQGLGLELSLEAFVTAERLSSYSFSMGGTRVIP